MNQDIFAGQWKQMRGELKSWWGRLADDDLERIGGHKDQLIGLVQEKYGYAREHAEQEVERHLKEFSRQNGWSRRQYDCQGAGAWYGCREQGQRSGHSRWRENRFAGACDSGKCSARRTGGNRGDCGSRWAGIYKLLLAREKIRPSGKRRHCFGPQLSCASVTDRCRPWLFAGSAPEIKHGHRGSKS